MKPRGLMVIHQFRPIMSGAELQAERLAAKLVALGHPMQVLTELRDPNSLPEEDLNGVQVHRVPFPLAYQIVFGIADTFRYLVKNRQTFDVLHVHQAFGHAVVSIVVARSFRKKCIVKIACAGSYGDLNVFSRFSGFKWALHILHQADAIVATSREIEDELLHQWDFAPSRVIRIPNGVDIEFFKRNQPLPPRDPIRFVLVGRRTPQKGIDIALRAVKLLADQAIGNFELKFYGPDYPEYDYRSLANELQVSYLVEFLPFSQAIRDILHSAHCLILPSRGEGMPNIVLEAMSFGLPVIASRVSGTVDIIDDQVNGILIPTDSPDALAEAMTNIICSPELGLRLGQQARQKVIDCFSLDSVAQQYSELYQRLCKPDGVE